MKTSFVFLFSIAFVLPILAQTGSVLDRTKLALKSGNSQQMGQMMAEKLQFGFEGEASLMSAKDVELKLSTFYKTNQVLDLSQLFQGQSKDGKQYFIGLLKTKAGTFRASVYWIESPKPQVLSIDFSKE